ncbi:MAG: amidohydrolase family protein [Gammaproteobacteria bacterium]|nr:amidohydrolase family protein [Gammaproteobacteria bacterium]
MHVHAAGLGYGNSGAFIGEELKNSWKFGIYLRAFNVTEQELRAEGDRVLLRKLNAAIAASQYVDRAVILAMDGVIDEHGKLDKARTQFYVPNDYLIRELPSHPRLMFGASVNPMRRDSIARLEHAVANGATLIKWLPNIMHFDPSHPRIEPFYRRMAELCVPLLTHAGDERSFGEADDTLGDPMKLELALASGVTVIAAHIATTGSAEGEGYFERFLRMYAQYPNLYADISSLTQINKLGYLRKALSDRPLHARLIYGTDWPLQFFPLVSPFYHLRSISIREAIAVQRLRNQWDRDVVLKKYMNVPEEVFTRFPQLLEQPCNDSASS